MTNAWTERIAELEAKLDTFETENRRLREALDRIMQRANEHHTGEFDRDIYYAMYQIAREAREG